MCITQDIYATNVLKMELLRDEDEESESNINNTRVGQQLNSYDMNKCSCKCEIQDKEAAGWTLATESDPCRWLNKHLFIWS